ncbi:M23 family metallopeptidase [Rhodovulum euryhalinum]|uniref:Peptidase M23-like protein n=1 Tax=Rhodovulum euryhalinum TaxID=35805 RepID=A0A4R2KDP4_9RHOB|nr:M23 family metallopeptidase [Rhodovulum euryhalinum]TCO71711.1 peptidase M23-like protein [Rhodovulum euryhalinum]
MSLAARPAAGDILLAVPLDCWPGYDCTILAHVDRDPGPGTADYTCGPLSRDGLVRTEFAAPPGTAVLAPAPGTVIALRDGLTDTPQPTDNTTPADCGNGVVIDHGAHWQTRYCHLAQGSVAVPLGRRVAKGTRLGSVGTSGGAGRAMLGFELRRRGSVVDPFAPDDPVACDGRPRRTLWQAPPAYPRRDGAF